MGHIVDEEELVSTAFLDKLISQLCPRNEGATAASLDVRMHELRPLSETYYYQEIFDVKTRDNPKQ